MDNPVAYNRTFLFQRGVAHQGMLQTINVLCPQLHYCWNSDAIPLRIILVNSQDGIMVGNYIPVKAEQAVLHTSHPPATRD